MLVLAELGEHPAVVDDVGVQEAQVDAIELQRLEAAFERAADAVPRTFVDGIAEHDLGGDTDSGWEVAAEGLGHHEFGLAASVGRREVEQVDAGRDRGVHGGDRLASIGRPPHLAEPTAPEGQGADGTEGAEVVTLQLLSRPVAR